MTPSALEAPRAGRTSEGRRGRTRRETPGEQDPRSAPRPRTPAPAGPDPGPMCSQSGETQTILLLKRGGRWLGPAAQPHAQPHATQSGDPGQISPLSGEEWESDLCFMKRKRLNNCKSAVANSCQITINTVTRDPGGCLPLFLLLRLLRSAILLGLYPGKQTEGLGICGGVMGARWRSATGGGLLPD